MKNRQMINRIQIRSNSKFGRIIVLTGARQTGKSKIVKRAFSDFQFISIEDPVVDEEYKKLSASQWSLLYPKAILDEVQKEPRIVESIKAVYDQFPETKYILLGSSQILLLSKIRESLAGRCQILELYPLTLPELMTNSWESEIVTSYFQNILESKTVANIPFLLDTDHPRKLQVFNNFLDFGSYPAISDEALSVEEKKDWLRNYVRTYLERDIRDLAELRQLEPFTKVQKLIAINTAQLTNYSKIAAEAGVSLKTVQRFIEYMSISYQTLVLQSWSRNSSKRLSKSPKVHYLDVGVMRAVLQKNDKLSGHEFESAIVSEIFKQAKQSMSDLSFYHLRTSDGSEVDLLIELEHGYIAIEIKQSSFVRNEDAIHLKGLETILDKPVLYKYVLSNDLSYKDLGDGVIGMPAVQFLM